MENEEWITGNVVLLINGQPVEMELTVPATPVKPQRMLPIFQKMSSDIASLSTMSVEAQGGKISCKAGCGACCRQAVPISEVEAYQLAELVEAMPEPRRSVIKKRFEDALEHITATRWFDDMVELREMARTESPAFSQANYTETVTKYMEQDVACPFLEDESCSIHADRPLVCREYLVTSPAENCKYPTAETIRKVPIILKPSKAMLKVGNIRIPEGVSLVLIEALRFVERHPDEFDMKPGDRWAAEFFGQLTETDIVSSGDTVME